MAVAITAAAFLLPVVPARADDVGPSSEPKYAHLDQSLGNNSCSTVVNATAGMRIRVWSVRAQNKTATASTFRIGQNSPSGCSSIAGSPAWKVGSNASFDASGDSRYPLYETTVTAANLQVAITQAASDWAISVVYTEFDPAAPARYNATHFDATPDVHVTNSGFECTEGCSGGGAGGDVTLTAIEDQALATVNERGEQFVMYGVLAVILLTGILIRLYPRKKLPL